MRKLYAIVSRDVPDAEARRDSARAAHFAHLRTIEDRIAVAGPLHDAAGRISGSLVLLRAESEADARAVLEADPYFQAGVWTDIRIEAFTAAAGDWLDAAVSKGSFA